MEYFDASHHFIGQRRSVRCDYWSIVFAGFTRRIFLLIRLSVPIDFLRIFGRLSDRLCSFYRARSSTERSRARSNSCIREELAARYHNFLIPD
jgi:hypothetical protein